MSVLELFRRGNNRRVTARPGDVDPVLQLQRDVNRLFDTVVRSFTMTDEGDAMSVYPHIEVFEDDRAVSIVAELPGVDPKDVQILAENKVVTLSGERRQEHRGIARYVSERRYGRFSRRIYLPVEVNAEEAAASFRNGLLSLTLPKMAQTAPKERQIAIRHS